LVPPPPAQSMVYQTVNWFSPYPRNHRILVV
jgi:hypothetical protein